MATKVHDWRAESENLEFDDLEERLNHYKQLRDGKMDERRKTAVAQIKELMAKNDISPEDLIEKAPESKRPQSTGRKMAPKYRDPSNPENQWTGQGKAPKWMPENREQWPDFLIQT